MSLKSKQKERRPLPGPHLLVCLRIVSEGPKTTKDHMVQKKKKKKARLHR